MDKNSYTILELEEMPEKELEGIILGGHSS